MWRYVAAKGLTCCKRPGVNQQPGDEFVVREKYERHSMIAFPDCLGELGEYSLRKGANRLALIAVRRLRKELMKGWLDESEHVSIICIAMVKRTWLVQPPR